MDGNWKHWAFMLLVQLIANRGVEASTVVLGIDPGAIGPAPSKSLSIDLPQLIGVDLPSGETSFDLVFDDDKYVVLNSLAAGDRFRYRLFGTYTPAAASMSLAGNESGDYYSEYRLFDRAGGEISPWDYVVIGGRTGTFDTLIEHKDRITELEGVLISGLRLGFVSSMPIQFSTATLTLELRGAGSMQIVIAPEPSILSLALVFAPIVLGLGRPKR